MNINYNYKVLIIKYIIMLYNIKFSVWNLVVLIFISIENVFRKIIIFNNAESSMKSLMSVKSD